MHWASQLKRYRRNNGLTQIALAEMLNVEQATISRWERGVHEPDLGFQRRLRSLIFGRGINSDHFIMQNVLHSPFAVKIANRHGQNLAASRTAAALHGVEQSFLATANYRPYFTEALERHWKMAIDVGFFDGDVAGVEVCNPWMPIGGGVQRICVSYWMPTQLSDGEIVLISDFRVMSEDEYGAMEKRPSFKARAMEAT